MEYQHRTRVLTVCITAKAVSFSESLHVWARARAPQRSSVQEALKITRCNFFLLPGVPFYKCERGSNSKPTSQNTEQFHFLAMISSRAFLLRSPLQAAWCRILVATPPHTISAFQFSTPAPRSQHLSDTSKHKPIDQLTPGTITKRLRVLDVDVVKKITEELRSVDANSDGRYVETFLPPLFASYWITFNYGPI